MSVFIPSRNRHWGGVLPFALLLAGGVGADPASAEEAGARDAEIEALRTEIDALRREYDERLRQLDARLAGLTAPAPEAPAPEAPPPAPAPAAAVPPPPPAEPPPAEAAVPAGAAGAGGPSGTLPVYGGTVASSKVFNPDIAVIGNFLGAAGESPGGGEPSLEMHEAEASFQAVVDPYARADFFLAFSPEEGVDIEEGFLTFPTLPGGFLAKVGKLKASFGKVNTMHAHSLPWTDTPLVNRNLLGGDEGIADAGISISRLVPNRLLFLEATGEVYRGEVEGVFTAPTRGDLMYAGRLRGYRDLGESSNIDIGGSGAWGTNDLGGTTRLLGVDATFRWRPLRRAIYRRFLARTELAWSRREAADGAGQDAFGFYASAEYQLSRRLFAGLRYDRSERADDPALRDEGGSALLTFWPSEFSQVRAQYRQTRPAEGGRDDELLFQFLFSIGAHGAHVF